MTDSQFVSELMLVVLENQVFGFDQDVLDDLYAKYEEPSDIVPEINQDAFLERFADVKSYITQMNRERNSVSGYARGFGNFYTLWCVVALASDLPAPGQLAQRYISFMQKVEELARRRDLDTFLREDEAGEYALPLAYLTNSRGANTDLGPRTERLAALKASVLGGSAQ